jgi:2-polyprenyl-3-methyl-5-hydroxy-6-metoxy-1,4-benzoquinol methylase
LAPEGKAAWSSVSDYVLDHHHEGEGQRLALMSRLLDPLHRRHLDLLGLAPGARTLEVGCGNGSVSAWLATRIAPGGRAVAVDLDLSLTTGMPAVQFRQADILAGPVPPADFDVVTCRAVLHHVRDAQAAVANLVASARPGVAILVIEPDFLPVSVAEPPVIRRFWQGWLAWSRQQTICQLRPRLEQSGRLDAQTIEAFLRRCADPRWWTQTIAFTAAHGRTRAS